MSKHKEGRNVSEPKSDRKKGPQPGNLTKMQKVIFLRAPQMYRLITRQNAYNAAHPSKALPEIVGGG